MGLHIVAAAVGVAEIEHVDDKRRKHAIHDHVAEHQPVNNGVLSAAAAGLYAQAAVGVVHQALGDDDIFHAAAHLTADDQAAMAAAQAAVADDHILAGDVQLHAHEQLARFQRNAVIAHMHVVADDVDILAALRVDAVGVGTVGAIADADVQDVHIL